jgi:tetratricopeptide (TPR) repeat protein
MNCRKIGCIILIWLISAIGCLKPPGINLPVPDLNEQPGASYSTGTLFKIDSCYKNLQDEYVNTEINGFVSSNLDLANTQKTAEILKEAALFSFSQDYCPDPYGKRVIEVFLYPGSDDYQAGGWEVYARSFEVSSIRDVSWSEVINYRKAPKKTEAQPDKIVARKKAETGQHTEGTAVSRPALSEKQRKELEKAIAAQTKFLEKNPDNSAAYNDRGNLYYRAGLYQQAVEDYSKAIDLDPDNAAAFNNRGNTYDKLGQPDKAIAGLTQAIEIDANYKEAYYNRATIFEKMGLQQRAIEDLDRTIAIDGKYYKAYFLKATALEKLNRTEEAIDAFRDFLRYVPPEFKVPIEYAENKIKIFEKEN